MSEIDNKLPDSQDKQAANSPSTNSRPSNRKGRPKGSKNHKTIVKEIAFEKHHIKIDGKKNCLTTMDLVLLELRNQAAQGKPQALHAYEVLLQKYGAQVINEHAGVLLAPAEMSPKEWIIRAEEANRTRKLN